MFNKNQIKEFIGKPVEHAEAHVKIVRVYCEDGKEYFITLDHVEDRLNVKLEKGIITDAFWG